MIPLGNAKRADTLRTASRRYNIFLQRLVYGSDPLRRVTTRLGDFVRFPGTSLMCSFARTTKGVPTVASLLVDRNRTPISGAHGFSSRAVRLRSRSPTRRAGSTRSWCASTGADALMTGYAAM